MKGLILVTGSLGLVGSRFVELYSQKSTLHLPTQVEFDITDKKQIAEVLSGHKFSTVINFAAYTDVGKAEEQRGDRKSSCWQVNAEGPRNLATLINPVMTKLIQISTDMVFSGGRDDKGPYAEDHQPEGDSQKVTWYGFTKAEGERAVTSVLGEKATILRLIYPVRAHYKDKLDYLRKPLKLFDEGKLYPMFVDQQVSISFIDEICVALELIINGSHTGIFHAASKDIASPYELASYLIEKARGKKNAVEKTSLDEFLKKVDNPIRYPKYGGLKVDQTEKKLGIKYSSWRGIIDELVAQGVGK